MDTELAEFLEEQKRQEQMLRELGIFDEPAEPEAEQAEKLPLVADTFDQVQEQAHQEQLKEEEAAAEPHLLPKLTPPPILAEAPRIALSIGAEGRGMAHVKPFALRSPAGRDFHDFTTRVYATDAHGWLASFDAFQKATGDKPTGLDLDALLPEAEDMAADLLSIAKKTDWPLWTMSAAPEFFPILAAAFRQSVKEGLPLVPDFGQSKQGALYQSMMDEQRRAGILDRAKSKTLALQAMPQAERAGIMRDDRTAARAKFSDILKRHGKS